MFFSKYMFVTKGKLAKVWLAAHWKDTKKLRKPDVEKTNIEDAVNDIINPLVQLALRVSGQLLIGVTRIYVRKVEYLLTDSDNALSVLKNYHAKVGLVNLPLDAAEAPDQAILLSQDPFELDICEVPALTLDELAKLGDDLDTDLHIGRQEDITLPDQIPSSPGGAPSSRDQSLLMEDQPDPLMELQPMDGEDIIGLGPLDVPMPDFDEFQADDQKLDLDISVEEGRDISIGVPTGDISSISGGIPDVRSSVISGDDGKGKPLDQIDILPVDLPQNFDISEEPPKKKQKRRFDKRLQSDKKTELTSAEIRKGLEDTSNITHEQRPRANLRNHNETDFENKSELAILFRTPAISGLAAELVNFYKDSTTAIPPAPLEKEEPTTDGVRSVTDVADTISTFIALPDVPMIADIPEVPEPVHPDIEPPANFFPQDAPEKDNKHRFDMGIGDTADFFGAKSNRPLKTTGSGWSRRTQKMYLLMQNMEAEKTSFSEMAHNQNRMTVAGIFHELLVLKSNSFIDVSQDKPFGEISIEKLHKFDAPLPEEFEGISGNDLVMSN